MEPLQPLHPHIYKDEDVELFVEDSSMGWIIHCLVHKWSKDQYSKFLDIWVAVQEVCPHGKVYAYTEHPKVAKFAEMFGFYMIDEIHHPDGTKKGELLECSIQ